MWTEGNRVHLSPLGWMFVGYSAMWAAIVAYVGNLGRRQRRLQQELEALRTTMDAPEEGNDRGGH